MEILSKKKLILDYIADSIFSLSNVGKDDSSDIVHDEHEESRRSR